MSTMCPMELGPFKSLLLENVGNTKYKSEISIVVVHPVSHSAEILMAGFFSKNIGIVKNEMTAKKDILKLSMIQSITNCRTPSIKPSREKLSILLSTEKCISSVLSK